MTGRVAVILPGPRYNEVLNFVAQLSAMYPNFDVWFNKIWPEIGVTRRLITVERHNQIIGLGIAKKTESELKLCTVRVVPAYANRCYGIAIMDDLLHWMDTNQPLATVNQQQVGKFERIFSSYGFVLSNTVKDLYNKGQTEHVFNDFYGPG